MSQFIGEDQEDSDLLYEDVQIVCIEPGTKQKMCEKCKGVFPPNDVEEERSSFVCTTCNYISASCVKAVVDGKITIKQNNGLQVMLSCDHSLIEDIYDTKLEKFTQGLYANLFGAKFEILTKDSKVMSLGKCNN